MKQILVFFLLSITFFAHAGDKVPSSLVQSYAASIDQLSQKLVECRESEKPLDKGALQNLGLTKDELRIVLAYQFSRLGFECSKQEYSDYLIAAKAMAEFTPNPAQEFVEATDNIVTAAEKYRWDAIERYNGLPEAVKHKVKASGLFTAPFDLLESMPLAASDR